MINKIFLVTISPLKGGNSTEVIIAEIRGMIKWYLTLGAASILCHWIGFALWV